MRCASTRSFLVQRYFTSASCARRELLVRDSWRFLISSRSCAVTSLQKGEQSLATKCLWSHPCVNTISNLKLQWTWDEYHVICNHWIKGAQSYFALENLFFKTWPISLKYHLKSLSTLHKKVYIQISTVVGTGGVAQNGPLISTPKVHIVSECLALRSKIKHLVIPVSQ